MLSQSLVIRITSGAVALGLLASLGCNKNSGGGLTPDQKAQIADAQKVLKDKQQVEEAKKSNDAQKDELNAQLKELTERDAQVSQREQNAALVEQERAEIQKSRAEIEAKLAKLKEDTAAINHQMSLEKGEFTGCLHRIVNGTPCVANIFVQAQYSSTLDALENKIFYLDANKDHLWDIRRVLNNSGTVRSYFVVIDDAAKYDDFQKIAEASGVDIQPMQIGPSFVRSSLDLYYKGGGIQKNLSNRTLYRPIWIGDSASVDFSALPDNTNFKEVSSYLPYFSNCAYISADCFKALIANGYLSSPDIEVDHVKKNNIFPFLKDDLNHSIYSRGYTSYPFITNIKISNQVWSFSSGEAVHGFLRKHLDGDEINQVMQRVEGGAYYKIGLVPYDRSIDPATLSDEKGRFAALLTDLRDKLPDSPVAQAQAQSSQSVVPAPSTEQQTPTHVQQNPPASAPAGATQKPQDPGQAAPAPTPDGNPPPFIDD